MDAYLGGSWWVRLLIQRGVAAMYLCAFVSALYQFRPLLGSAGLLPVPRWLKHVTFAEAPSLFHVRYSDRFAAALIWIGIAVSGLALVGIVDRGPVWLGALAWLMLWIIYLSFVNVGQVFYAFGWESMLLEAGFFVSFLGPSHVAPPAIPIIALRWMLFRAELGAGLIKLRHDSCWRDLTCLYYHYETQPLPNMFSWYFHWLPHRVHRLGVIFSHFVQLVVPFGLFLPQPFAACSGALIIGHQLLLIVSGNYSWLNWLTVVLAFSAFGDSTVAALFGVYVPITTLRAAPHELVLYALGVITLALSVKPALNLIDKHQRMNFNFNPLHIVNAYGAFGSITRERYEVVLEGAADKYGREWREYVFWGKPGDPKRLPPQVAPYHLRLDWLMWFLAIHAVQRSRTPDVWFVRLVDKLLEGDRAVASLFRHNPFPDRPPRQIRALVYVYSFSSPSEHRANGAWWRRERVGELYRSQSNRPSAPWAQPAASA